MTERQAQILATIIEIYARTAEPVSSLAVAGDLEGSCSPATIRAEMAALERAGCITHPHTSAGRVPTDKGYRYYVDSLAASKTLTRAFDGLRRRAEKIPHDEHQAVKTIASTLADLTDNMSLATLGSGLQFYGFSNLFGQPEFFSQEQAYEAARFLDSVESWIDEADLSEPLNVYIGAENPIGKSSGLSLVVSKFNSPYREEDYIGVVGPTRQSYEKVMFLVDRAGRMLEEILN